MDNLQLQPENIDSGGERIRIEIRDRDPFVLSLNSETFPNFHSKSHYLLLDHEEEDSEIRLYKELQLMEADMKKKEDERGKHRGQVLKKIKSYDDFVMFEPERIPEKQICNL